MANISKKLPTMAKRILILGKGFVGSRLQEYFKCPISDKKIYTFEDAQALLDEYKPQILINCIGHTGENNVDDCEKVKDKTITANTFVPILLAECTLRNNIKMVQIGSGCVYHFDYLKQKPITENKISDYFDLFYSRTKIYCEDVLAHLAKNYNILIARVRVPLDIKPHPKNILTKLIEYKTVINIPNSVTYIPDLVKMIKHLLKIDARGVFNTVNKGALYYPELLKVYQKYHPEFKFKIIDIKALKIKRTNLILSTQKLEKTGFKVRTINEILKECVQNYLKSS